MRAALRRYASAVLVVLTVSAGLAAAACGRAEDTAPPVATPSVVLSQSEAPVGSPIDVTYRFVVAADAPAFDDDYWVFVHFLDADRQLVWTEDHQPPTPTRQWTAGSTIEYTRTAFVPRLPDAQTLTIEMGLFSPGTGARLPLAGQTEGQRSYRVGSLGLRLETPLVMAFGAGWHEVEVSDDAIGVEWQWTRDRAMLSFQNPGRDAEFFLQLDQPARLDGAPQQVQVLVGSAVVDSFPLPSGEVLLRRLALSPAQMGSGETVEVTITVDRMFVPAAIPALGNPDSRQLGVRVLRAFVRPT